MKRWKILTGANGNVEIEASKLKDILKVVPDSQPIMFPAPDWIENSQKNTFPKPKWVEDLERASGRG